MIARCLASVIFLLAANAFANDHVVGCTDRKNAELNKLEKVHALNGIRVFYTEVAPVSGKDHRLPKQSQTDGNANGVPDYIENIAIQANVARKVYNALGFTDPTLTEKYRAVKYIDINVMNIRPNGLAFNSPVRYSAAPGRGEACTLRVDISTQLEAQVIGSAKKPVQAKFTRFWFVVAHEVFHLYQYGQTPLKSSWWMEPTARLMEYAFRSQAHYPSGMSTYKLPVSRNELDSKVVALPNGPDAMRFWTRMAMLHDGGQDVMTISDELLHSRYTDGQPVLKDNKFIGYAFLQSFMNELKASDNSRVLNNNRSVQARSEQGQTSRSNDSFIIKSLQGTLQSTGVNSPEVASFMSVEP